MPIDTGAGPPSTVIHSRECPPAAELPATDGPCVAITALAPVDAIQLTGSQGTPSRRKRDLAAVDILRVVAAFGVVVWHVCDRVVSGLEPVSRADWWIANFAQSFGCAAVPLFVLVSGALLLDAPAEQSVVAFLRRRAGRVLVPLVFWFSLYLALRWFAAHLHLADFPNHFTRDDLLDALYHGTPWYHLWFLAMVVGLYVFTPPLRIFVQHSTAAGRRYVAILGFAIASVYFCPSMFFSDRPQVAWVMFVAYTPYFLCGYHFTRSPRPGLPNWVLAISAVAGLLATAATCGLLVHSDADARLRFVSYSYFSPWVIVMSLAFFALVMRRPWGNSLITKICRRLAPLTFGIYLVHPIAMAGLRHVVHLSGSKAGALPGILLTSLSVFALSALFTYVVVRVPYLRRIC